MKKISILSILIISIFSSNAWEVDNFTNREKYYSLSEREKLENLYTLNDQTNRMIQMGLDRMNRIRSCTADMKRDIPTVHYVVRSVLGGGLVEGALEDWAQNNKKIHTVEANQDLYDGIWSVDTSLNVNGHIVGIDKLGHFFDQGHELFEMNYQSGDEGGIEQAMLFSNDLENQHYGIGSSGVKSYGDMAANTSGMDFFLNLIDGSDSYLRCNKSTGKYEARRDFDWSDFVDDSWDEGVNCSKFYRANNPYSKWINIREEQNVKMEGKSLTSYFSDVHYFTDEGKALKKNLKKMNLRCPVDMVKCHKIAKMECATYFVSPECLKKAKQINSKCEQKEMGAYNVKSSKSGYLYRRSGNSDSGNQKQTQSR